MNLRRISLAVMVCFAIGVTTSVSHAADDPQNTIRNLVDTTIRPVMARNGIPGMAVGIAVAGKTYVFDYGEATTATHRPVTRYTLFEIGSITKTFTATLAAYAQISGNLSLSDKVDKYLPALQETQFGGVTLVNLGTHTPGGLPLQVPDDIRNNTQLMHYFEAWRPAHPPGTYRTYSNLSIGMLGLIAAKSMGQDFTVLMQKHLFSALGMDSSYIEVPATRMPDYAQGYTKKGAPIRMATGVLSSEAYGIKTTAADMVRFVEANMDLIELDPKLQHAIMDTHTSYFRAAAMTQDLIWEQYPYPVALKTLLDGNAPAMSLHATPVAEVEPPGKPRDDVWMNKTGSTNGFGAYVAFVPEKQLGIVILANRNYPIDDRVTIAYEILTSLADEEH